MNLQCNCRLEGERGVEPSHRTWKIKTFNLHILYNFMNANIKRTELNFYIILYDYLYMHLTMTTYVNVLTLNL